MTEAERLIKKATAGHDHPAMVAAIVAAVREHAPSLATEAEVLDFACAGTMAALTQLIFDIHKKEGRDTVTTLLAIVASMAAVGGSCNKRIQQVAALLLKDMVRDITDRKG